MTIQEDDVQIVAILMQYLVDDVAVHRVALARRAGVVVDGNVTGHKHRLVKSACSLLRKIGAQLVCHSLGFGLALVRVGPLAAVLGIGAVVFLCDGKQAECVGVARACGGIVAARRVMVALDENRDQVSTADLLGGFPDLVYAVVGFGYAVFDFVKVVVAAADEIACGAKRRLHMAHDGLHAVHLGNVVSVLRIIRAGVGGGGILEIRAGDEQCCLRLTAADYRKRFVVACVQRVLERFRVKALERLAVDGDPVQESVCLSSTAGAHAVLEIMAKRRGLVLDVAVAALAARIRGEPALGARRRRHNGLIGVLAAHRRIVCKGQSLQPVLIADRAAGVCVNDDHRCVNACVLIGENLLIFRSIFGQIAGVGGAALFQLIPVVCAAGQAGGELQAVGGGLHAAGECLEVHGRTVAGPNTDAVLIVRHTVEAEELIAALRAGGIDLQLQHGSPVARYGDTHNVTGGLGRVAGELALAVLKGLLGGDHVQAFPLADLRNGLLINGEFLCICRIGKVDVFDGGNAALSGCGANGCQHRPDHAYNQNERQDLFDVFHVGASCFF